MSTRNTPNETIDRIALGNEVDAGVELFDMIDDKVQNTEVPAITSSAYKLRFQHITSPPASQMQYLSQSLAFSQANHNEEELDMLLNLDLEERRKRNIERNQLFLKNLFASFDTNKTENSMSLQDLDEARADSFLDKSNEMKRMKDEMTLKLQNLIKLFPYHEFHINSINRYIETAIETVSAVSLYYELLCLIDLP